MQTTHPSGRSSGTDSRRAASAIHRTTTPMRIAGRTLAAFLSLFLLFDGAARVAGFAPYVEGTVQAGYPASYGVGIGTVLILCTALYLLPRTAVLGAILLTGYLGAAVATNLRTGLPFAFPLIFGVLVWGALYLLDGRVREMIPLRRQTGPGLG